MIEITLNINVADPASVARLISALKRVKEPAPKGVPAITRDLARRT